MKSHGSLLKPELLFLEADSLSVPFLYGGVVKEYAWLNEQQFLDAVAVAMITPGPVVTTVGFIGYLVAGIPGACVAALATFIPCYFFTVIPAPYLKKIWKASSYKSFCGWSNSRSDWCYCRCGIGTWEKNIK